ncbi:MAG: DUF192 domain-containing protein [Patescibacteria group bacterium]|nr:DUF192 domain-containing protein [Patescibacteria group bacterium]
MLSRRDRLIIAGLLVALLSFSAAHFSGLTDSAYRTSSEKGNVLGDTVQLKGQTIRVAIVDTPDLRAKGLGGRESLARDEGMLFVFPESGIYGFWMKDMRFAIDILWLSRDGDIVYMVQNVSPDTYPQDFTPDKEAVYVLELPSGWVSEYNVRIGDHVRL